MLSSEDKSLAEDYIDGNLNEEQKKLFENRVVTDKLLKLYTENI